MELLAFKNLKDFLESYRVLRNEKPVFVVHLNFFPKIFDGWSIRENIRSLVAEFGNKEVPSPRSTCFFLIHQDKGFIIPLYLIENDEEILEPGPPSIPCCQHCLLAGWCDHLMTRRNYHIVIPNRWWERPVSDEGLVNDESHILHILLHSNGFGHLIRMGGVRDSDIDLPADEVRELYRRFCKHLGARKLSRVIVEEWPVVDDPNAEHLTFVMTPQLEELKFMPAGEVVFHPYMESFEELKNAAENALRATYCVLKNFTITHIKGKNIEEWKEELPILEGIESGEELYVKGSGLDMETTVRYQGGHRTR